MKVHIVAYRGDDGMNDLAQQVLESLPALRLSVLRETEKRLRGGATIGIAKNGEILQVKSDARSGAVTCRSLGRYDGSASPVLAAEAPAASETAVPPAPVSSERLDRK